MAAILPQLLETAAAALVRGLGFVAVALGGSVTDNEVAKRKVAAADKAREAPYADAGTQSRQRESCAKCPPDCGELIERRWNMSDVSRDYQARITGFAPMTEWKFGGLDFDGFKSAECLLLEAKARYDQFFTASNEPMFFFSMVGVKKILSQATSQSLIVEISVPTRLNWHFMQPRSFAYFSRQFSKSLLLIKSFHSP